MDGEAFATAYAADYLDIILIQTCLECTEETQQSALNILFHRSEHSLYLFPIIYRIFLGCSSLILVYLLATMTWSILPNPTYITSMYKVSISQLA